MTLQITSLYQVETIKPANSLVAAPAKMRCTPSLLVSALARLLLLLGTRAREDETMHVLSTLQHSLMVGTATWRLP